MQFVIVFSDMSIPRFGFLVALIAYLALLFVEYLRPGFVSNAMNAHVLWMVIAGFGIWESVSDGAETILEKKSLVLRIGLLLVGFLLALIVWHLGSVFGDMRLFFALAVGILPIVLLK